MSILIVGCAEEDALPVFSDDWQVAVDIEDAALLSVHGTAADNVWIVGADDGEGPVVLQFNGEEWTRHDTGISGDLWWVRAFDDGTVFMAGSDAHVLRYKDGEFERLKSPGLGRDILFGIWGSAPDDIYAVGSAGGRNGFIWHFDGADWSTISLPDTVELDAQNDLPNLTKVWVPMQKLYGLLVEMEPYFKEIRKRVFRLLQRIQVTFSLLCTEARRPAERWSLEAGIRD